MAKVWDFQLWNVDIKALGLKVAENFISLNNQSENIVVEEPDPYSPGYTQPGGNDMYPPRFEGSRGSYENYRDDTDGTVGMDGAGGIKSGGTVGM